AKMPIWQGGRLLPSLWFPAIGIITAAVLLRHRLKQEFSGANAAALFLSADLLLAVGYLSYQQYRGIPALGYYFHSSFMLPFAFLVLGISFWPAVEKMSPVTYVVTCAVAAIAFAAVWYE